MADTPKTPELLLPAEAAERLRVTEYTLRRWRSEGLGPEYIKTPTGTIRYRPEDLDRYMAG